MLGGQNETVSKKPLQLQLFVYKSFSLKKKIKIILCNFYQTFISYFETCLIIQFLNQNKTYLKKIAFSINYDRMLKLGF